MPHRYKAFISYSHADRRAVEWLHRRIETFATPKALIGTTGARGAVAARLKPVFRDRDELATSSALGSALTDALQNSEFLIVMCSPASAQSQWVNEEIRTFRRMHGDERVFAVIVAGDPAAAAGPGKEGCFPPALVAPSGGAAPLEPIAADFRKEGDGRRAAFLKLAAGMLGVGMDDLVRRDERRRADRLRIAASVAGAVALAMTGLAFFANFQRIEADRQRAIAAEERDTANAALDYLVGIFRIANPATEKAKDITALTVLERGLKDIDKTFAEKPIVQAKLLGVMGDVYANLGEIELAKTTLEAAIAKPGGRIEDRIEAELRLADVLTKSMKLDQSETLLAEVETLIAAATAAEKPTPQTLELWRGRLAERRAEVSLQRVKEAEAIDQFAAAKAHFSRAGEGARVLLARALSSRGVVLARAKRFDEAKVELEAAITLQTALFGPEHVETAVAVHNLAYMLFKAGQLDAADSRMADALALYQRALEPNHPLISTAALLLGRIREAKGDFAGAVEAHSNSVASTRTTYGPTNERVGFRLLYLALAQAKAGAPDRALLSLDEAQTIYDASFPSGDFNHGDIKVYRAMVLSEAGRAAEARALCTDGLTILAANLKPGDAYLAEMTGHCAKIAG